MNNKEEFIKKFAEDFPKISALDYMWAKMQRSKYDALRAQKFNDLEAILLIVGHEIAIEIGRAAGGNQS